MSAKDNPDARRLARLEISPELIIGMCHQSEWPIVSKVAKNPIPAGAKLVGVNYDAIRDVWCIGLQHSLFDVVAYGEQPPLLPPVEVTSSLGAYQRMDAELAKARDDVALLSGALTEAKAALRDIHRKYHGGPCRPETCEYERILNPLGVRS